MLSNYHLPAERLALRSYFEKISSGEIQVPCLGYIINDNYRVSRDESHLSYLKHYISNMTPFWRHFTASIPYLAEEHVRIAQALLKLQSSLGRDLNVYAPENADGTDMRTLSQISEGKVRSLTNTGTLERFSEPFKYKDSNHLFIEGPYLQLTHSDIFRVVPGISSFDVIIVNVAFQFNPVSRQVQIQHLKPLMNKKTILICYEKNTIKENEYLHRERIKDKYYKSIYFSEEEIKWKKDRILEVMQSMLVSHASILRDFRSSFRYHSVIWNACNFYGYIACDSKTTFDLFKNSLGPVYVPEKMIFGDHLD